MGHKFRRNRSISQFSIYKHFCVLRFLRKIQNSLHIWGDNTFLKIGIDTLQIYPVSSKSPYLTRFSRYKHFCVLQFLQTIRKFKMAAIFGETKIFQNCVSSSAEIPCGSKISSKSLYCALFSRYRHFLCFPYLENSSLPKSNDFQILIE